MLKRLSLVLAIAATALLALTAAPASADDRSSSSALAGARCVVQGVKFLASNGLLVKAALRQVDYEPLDSDADGAGVINTDLPSPSFLPLGDVIRLHYTNPELFDYCIAS